MAKHDPQEDFEVEDAARTLMKAEEIKKDKPLFKKAMTKLKEQQEAIGEVITKPKVEKIGSSHQFRIKRS